MTVGRDQGWNVYVTAVAAGAAALLIYGFLMACVPRRGELEEIR